MTKPKQYREIIDALVNVCVAGQGQIAVNRVRAGVWNAAATADNMPQEHAANVLLKRLSPSERETLAYLMASEFRGGVFETLQALEATDIEPFQDGYEGGPRHDFIGRLGGWQWPAN
jgi:hypothetical protein